MQKRQQAVINKKNNRPIKSVFMIGKTEIILVVYLMCII